MATAPLPAATLQREPETAMRRFFRCETARNGACYHDVACSSPHIRKISAGRECGCLRWLSPPNDTVVQRCDHRGEGYQSYFVPANAPVFRPAAAVIILRKPTHEEKRAPSTFTFEAKRCLVRAMRCKHENELAPQGGEGRCIGAIEYTSQ